MLTTISGAPGSRPSNSHRSSNQPPVRSEVRPQTRADRPETSADECKHECKFHASTTLPMALGVIAASVFHIPAIAALGGVSLIYAASVFHRKKLPNAEAMAASSSGNVNQEVQLPAQ
ncbi:MAG: hypothetical protein AAF621_03885 [Pseudomonadota bacterium]